MAESLLRRWMAQAGVDESNRPGLISDEGKELAQLRRRNCVLEVEKEILKRAAACFAKDEVLPACGSGSSANFLPRGSMWR